MALPAAHLVRQVFDLPDGSAEVSLKRYSEQTGLDVLFATQVTSGVKTKGIKGEFIRAEALNLLLADTGLVAACDEASGVFTIKRSIPKPMTPNILEKIRHSFMGLVLSLVTGHQLASQENPPASPPSEQTAESKAEILTLNPFIVVHKDEGGYGFSQSALGTRTVQPVLNIPSSVVSINRQFLDDLNSSTTVDALDYGVSGVTNSSLLSDDVNIRGFRSNQFLRDGVMVINFKRNPLYDVDRIEVIKGPSGLLLGNTLFIGGVVNYASKLPTEKRVSSIQTTASSRDNSIRLAANTSGPLTQSKDYTALYRVTVGGEWGDPEKTYQNIEQRFVGAALTFKYFQDRLRMDFVYYNFVDNGYNYFDDFLDINRSVVNGPAYLNQYSTRTFSPAGEDQVFWDQRQDYFNATFTGQLTENLNFRLFYVGHRVIDRRALLRAIGVQSDNKTLNRQDLPFAVDSNVDMIQAEVLYKTIRPSWRNDLQGGADAYFETFWQRYALYTPPPIDSSAPDYTTYTRPAFTDYTASNGRAEKRNGTYWVQNNLTLFNGRLILVGGFRWVDSYVVNENPLTKTSTIADSPLVRTHRYGVVFKPTEKISIYYTDSANVTAVGGVDGYGNAFKNQQGVMTEGGVKLATEYGNLSVSGSIAYFDMANTYVSMTKTDPVLGIILVQDPTGDTSKGWETELRLRWTTSDGFADLIGTYSDLTSFRVSTGRRALETPDTTYSLFGKYAWESGPLAGWTLGGGLHDQSMKLTGTYTTDFPITYSLLARYKFNRHWSMQLNGDNITDERYVVDVANAALAQASLGANYRLALKYDW